MAILLIGVAVVAAVVSAGTAVFVPAIVNVVASFWANGVLANHRGNPEGAPDWAATVSIITTIAAIALLVVGLVLR